MEQLIDIVIPVGPNDTNFLEVVVKCCKKNLKFRKIFVVGISHININGCDFISENIFPFSKSDVAKLHGDNPRNGWYLQQLLKLYAGKVIPGILNDYVVIDCDTFFLKPIDFKENGKYLFNTGDEYHIPYFVHMSKLHPSFGKICNLSGITHHMIFSTSILNEMFSLVEKYHGTLKPFWYIFLDCVDPSLRIVNTSGASEYELYFNYMLLYHYDMIKIRTLDWQDCGSVNLNANKDYISVHWWLR